MKYIIGSGDDWFKIFKNKKLMRSGKLSKMWDGESERYVGYVELDCHPVMIEVRCASPTHIYNIALTSNIIGQIRV